MSGCFNTPFEDGVASIPETRVIRIKYARVRQDQTGAMVKVGDDTMAVGLLDDDNSKVRSTGQAGSYNEGDGKLTYNQRRL